MRIIRNLFWKLKILGKKKLSYPQMVIHIAIILFLLNLFFLLLFSNLGLNLRVMNNPNSRYTTFTFAQEFIDNYTIDQRDYVKDEYMCKDFSKDAVKYAESMGGYCEIIGGFKSWDFTQGGHAWIRCDLSPQNLSFINYNAKYPIQVVLE